MFLNRSNYLNRRGTLVQTIIFWGRTNWRAIFIVWNLELIWGNSDRKTLHYSTSLFLHMLYTFNILYMPFSWTSVIGFRIRFFLPLKSSTGICHLKLFLAPLTVLPQSMKNATKFISHSIYIYLQRPAVGKVLRLVGAKRWYWTQSLGSFTNSYVNLSPRYFPIASE